MFNYITEFRQIYYSDRVLSKKRLKKLVSSSRAGSNAIAATNPATSAADLHLIAEKATAPWLLRQLVFNEKTEARTLELIAKKAELLNLPETLNDLQYVIVFNSSNATAQMIYALKHLNPSWKERKNCSKTSEGNSGAS